MIQIATPDIRHIFLHGFEIPMVIGIHEAEQRAPQRVRIDIDLGVAETGRDARLAGREDVAEVVNYEHIAEVVRGIVGRGHVKLVETLAEQIAAACLESDSRVLSARVRVGKPDIFPDIELAGAEILRRRG